MGSLSTERISPTTKQYVFWRYAETLECYTSLDVAVEKQSFSIHQQGPFICVLYVSSHGCQRISVFQ